MSGNVPVVLGIDPGRAKVGYAAMSFRGEVLAAGIVAMEELEARARELVARHGASRVALGRGTNAAAVADLLAALDVPVDLVDEFETTRRARERYFREHPPRGWRRLIPVGLQVPPCPVDDYAAMLIAERWLARRSETAS